MKNRFPMLFFDFKILSTFYGFFFKKMTFFLVFLHFRAKKIFFIISNLQIRVFQLKIPLYTYFKHEYANFGALRKMRNFSNYLSKFGVYLNFHLLVSNLSKLAENTYI